MKQKLIDRGFPSAEIFDSRRASALFCCFHVVVAGRYATKKEALGVARQARKQRFRDVYVRRGW